MSRVRSFLTLTALGAGLAGAAALASRGPGQLRAARDNMARMSMPSPWIYDATARLFFGPIFARIARDIAREAPAGASILDVGCGPGHLVIRLAQLDRGLQVTGVDLDAAMIGRAIANADRSVGTDGASRPAFVVGDVAQLPFPDGAFDLVVSTFSMHHWSDPLAGLNELHRVVRSGGRALIWDVAGPLRHLENRGPGPSELARRSAFRRATPGGRWAIGSVVLAERFDLARRPEPHEEPQPGQSEAGPAG